MKRKWKDARGETLVEVLAAILIGTLSVALLFSAVMASSRMDKTAQTADEGFHAALKAAEGQDVEVTPGAAADGKIIIPDDAKVTITGAGATATPPVTFYGGDGAVSYALKP